MRYVHNFVNFACKNVRNVRKWPNLCFIKLWDVWKVNREALS